MKLVDEINDLIDFFDEKLQFESNSSDMEKLEQTLRKLAHKGEKKKKLIDSKHDDGSSDLDDLKSANVTLPITPQTKIDKTVKAIDEGAIEEYYSKLIKLNKKIQALQLLEEDDLDDLENILSKAIKTYKKAENTLKRIAKETFPERLETFANVCKDSIVDLLSEEKDGEITYYFNTKTATKSRFVKYDQNSLIYSYKIKLEDVSDDNDFINKQYVIVISQRIDSDEVSNFYITRLLNDSVDYKLGKEFTTSKGMLRLLNSILNYDNIKSSVDKISIPFDESELSEQFISEHVKSVTVDHQNSYIVIKLTNESTEDDAKSLIPDFIKNLGDIINKKKIAVKYSITKTNPIKIEFILVQKFKDDQSINREQLLDMKERYNLTDDAYRQMLKFFIVGN